MEQKFILQLELIQKDLSPSFNSYFANFKEYISESNPRVFIFSTSDYLTNELNEYINDHYWKIFIFSGKELSSHNSDKQIKEIAERAYFSDYIIILTTALRIAPNYLYQIMKLINTNFNKKVFIVVGEFDQLPKKEKVVKRKLFEVGKAFEIMNIETFAYSKSNNKSSELVLQMKEITNSISNTIYKSKDRIRKEQKDKLADFLYRLAKEEANAINNDYQEIRKLINEERKLSHSAFQSALVLSKTVKSGFSEFSNNIFSKISDISWSEIENDLIDNNEDEDELYNNISNIILERFLNNVILNEDDEVSALIPQKIEDVIYEIIIIFKRNFNALEKVNVFDTDILKEMKISLLSESFFNSIKSESKDFSNQFNAVLEENISTIVNQNLKNIRVKALRLLMETKPNIYEDEESEETENNQNQTINYMRGKYHFAIDEAFKKLMNSIFITIKNDIVEEVENFITDNEKRIISRFNDSVEKYSQKQISFYTEFINSNEKKFHTVNQFLKGVTSIER